MSAITSNWLTGVPVLLRTPDCSLLLACGIGVSVLEGRSDEIYPTPSTEVIGPFGSQPWTVWSLHIFPYASDGHSPSNLPPPLTEKRCPSAEAMCQNMAGLLATTGTPRSLSSRSSTCSGFSGAP